MDSKIILICILIGIIIIAFWKSFFKPVKFIMKLVINSVLGGVLIFIINVVGTSFNFHIGLNFINALLVGILGIPRSYSAISF